MSATLTRLILCFGVLIGSAVLYILVFVILESGRGDDEALIGADLVTMAALATAWTLVWRGQVHWPRWRVWATVALAIGALVPAAMVGAATALAVRRGEELAILMAGMAWITAWLIGSALVWRERPAERAARLQAHGVRTISCPACSYNLTGLKSTTCPECGATYTVDQLVAEILEQQQPV
jgi:hypothetical protein